MTFCKNDPRHPMHLIHPIMIVCKVSVPHPLCVVFFLGFLSAGPTPGLTRHRGAVQSNACHKRTALPGVGCRRWLGARVVEDPLLAFPYPRDP
jgi:hypothetical protein